MKKILVVFGTRPEAIKMAPVIKQLQMENYDGIVLVVAHKEFRELEPKIKEIKLKNNNLMVYDIKGFFDKNIVDGRL